MSLIQFEAKAFEEYQNWIRENKKIALRIGELIKDINRNPFAGKGKPEPLKYKFSGYWSRRIDDEHRLIYSFKENVITIISCFSHYE